MPIRPEEIDQTIQNALKDRIAQIFTPNAVLDPMASRIRSAGQSAWRAAARRNGRYYWAAGVTMASSWIAPALLAVQGESAGVLAFFGLFAASFALLFAGHRRTAKDLTQYVSPDLMRGAGQLVALSRAEEAYCEALAALIDAGPVLGDVSQQEILRQINGLLENARRLEGPVKQARAASGAQSTAEIERELTDLEQRRNAHSDPDARATMDQSIDLCRRRLEASHAIDPARQKAEAQQELILQTLASVQASLARSTGSGATATPVDVAGLQESVLQVSTQTRAVEEAVAEVVSLGVPRRVGA